MPDDDRLAALDALLDRFDDEYPDLAAGQHDADHAADESAADESAADESAADESAADVRSWSASVVSEVAPVRDGAPTPLPSSTDTFAERVEGSPPTRAESSRAARVERRVVDADLPPLRQPSGYWRDGAGRWRYESTGEFVPGARDVTLARLHRFERCTCGAHLLVPEADTARPELEWVLSVQDRCASGVLSVRRWGRAIAAVAVPVAEWEDRSSVALTIDAPELCAEQLLDPTAAGLVLGGLSARTISAYLARGRIVEPVARVGGVPLWSRGVLLRWAATRPGQGRSGDVVRSHHHTK